MTGKVAKQKKPLTNLMPLGSCDALVAEMGLNIFDRGYKRRCLFLYMRKGRANYGIRHLALLYQSHCSTTSEGWPIFRACLNAKLDVAVFPVRKYCGTDVIRRNHLSPIS